MVWLWLHLNHVYGTQLPPFPIFCVPLVETLMVYRRLDCGYIMLLYGQLSGPPVFLAHQFQPTMERGRFFRGNSILTTCVFLWAGLSLAKTNMDLLNVHLEIEKSRKKERKVKDYSQRRVNRSVSTVTEYKSDSEFQRYLRMKRSSFSKLLFLVGHKLEKNIHMGDVAGRPTIAPDVRLAIFLRRMAGGCVDDIASSFDVSRDAVNKIFEETRKVVDEGLQFPGIPRSIDALKRMADDFQTSRSPANPLPGCIGALDGISIQIAKPSESENPASFWCRKGYYAIPVQAMCDAHYRFRCYSATCCGSTHDSLAHAVSALGDYLENGNLGIEFWIAGDEAYICSIFLVTPVPATQATPVEDAFNFYHSSSRMHIEQAFGMLIKKWSILKKLDFSAKKSSEVIGLAMKLHNFCIDHNGIVPSLSQPSEEEKLALDENKEWYSDGKHAYADQVDQQHSTAKRDHLVDIIKKGGFKRPPIRLVRVPDYYAVAAAA